MPSSLFVDRMNLIPKFVAVADLTNGEWLSRPVIDGHVLGFATQLKDQRDPQPGQVRQRNCPMAPFWTST